VREDKSNVAVDYELDPLHIFRFHVTFKDQPLGSGVGDAVELCSGAFAECTGLEATMEPKVIKEGGRNYGAAQRAGQVTFSTVILKRGITTTRHLWQWWELCNVNSAYAHRLEVTITLADGAGNDVLAWKLDRAMPIKFKSPDMNAKGTEIGIEELHLVHEGLRLIQAG
jgi:phage tail-like protein